MKIQVKAQIQRASGFSLSADFEVETSALGLVGPSGSGKSSLLEAIAGLETGARVLWDGVDLSSLPAHQREFGYVSQEPLLFPHLNVRKNLLFSPRATELGDLPEALQIAHLLDRMPRNLSGGEKRRVSLARAILSRPRALLLDEPFAGLDESRRRESMSLLAQVCRQYQLPMILVSHFADEVVSLTDFSIRLENGRILESGHSSAILQASETRVDNYFVGEVIAPNRVRVGESELFAALPESAKGKVRLGCYAHEIVLASQEPQAISARNLIRTSVHSMVESRAAVLIELSSPRLRVTVTKEAVDSLQLKPGTPVFAIFKATSVTYLDRDTGYIVGFSDVKHS